MRGVRFALRFRLEADPETQVAMFRLAPLLDRLARERIFDELCKLLLLVTAEDLMTYAPIITQVIPELADTIDFQQHNPHHAYDVYRHTAYVVAGVPAILSLRLAALLHDIGKPRVFTLDENGRGHFLGHAAVGAEIAAEVLRRLKAPTELREQVVFLIAHHMTPMEPDRKLLRRRLGKYGTENCRLLLALQEADFCSKGVFGEAPPFSQLLEMIDTILREADCLSVKDLAINGKDLMATGFAPGPQLGNALGQLLAAVQDDRIPNEKAPLLQAAHQLLKREDLV